MPRSRTRALKRLARVGTALALLLPAGLVVTGTTTAGASSVAGSSGRLPLQSGDTLALAEPTADGIQIYVSDPASSDLRPLTRLWVAGWDVSQWTADDCITGDGRYMAVTFAPATFANDSRLQGHGAFGAVVNLRTGERWIVPRRVALQYHTPGCGTGDLVVWASYPDNNWATTDLLRVDATHKRLLDSRHIGVQLTSAVPVGSGVVAAAGNQLVSVSPSGRLVVLARAGRTVFDLRPNADSGVDFLAVTDPDQSTAMQWTRGGTRNIGSGPLHRLDLVQGAAGHNHLVGQFRYGQRSSTFPTLIAANRLPATVSLHGSMVIDQEQFLPAAGTDRGQTWLQLKATAVRRGVLQSRSVSLQPTAEPVDASPDSSPQAAPRTASPMAAPVTAGASPGNSPCAVGPLDPATQIVQPSPAQVTWAANRAVRGELTIARPANWEKHGLSSYTPQSLFPLPALVGGGHVPVQVLEGILAQESNFDQASSHALPGVASDPLIANYYGAVYDSNGLITSIDSTQADCGYGLGQITTHMRSGDATWSPTLQREVATDYEVNIAATVSFLGQFWNQLHSSPENVIANDGLANEVENWYFTIWAYNSGIQPTAAFGNTTGCIPGPSCLSTSGHWGLGWTNNPAQNAYDPSRQPFLQASYADAAHPERWPYQEKVLGWAHFPQQDFVNGGFKYSGSVALLLPPYFQFCSSLNNCSSGSASTGYCLSTDRTTCWWNAATSWMNNGAGHPENSADYQSGAAEPALADPYPASCTAAASPVVDTPGTTALPTGAVIVDDLPDSSTNLAGCPTVTSSGSFSLAYGTDAGGNPTAAVDMHQLGVGYLGHSYFTHTVGASRSLATVTATWHAPQLLLGWQRVWVHIPNNGAVTFQADYQIHTGDAGSTYHRVVNQRWNQNSWFDLGSFPFQPNASVSLSNATKDDYNAGAIDIAFDAVAFTPSFKPTVDYVAIGDSYTAGEGVEPYYANADNGGGTSYVDKCHRSPQAYPNLVFNDLSLLHAGGENEFHFIACSGATTDNLLNTDDSNEVPQLQSGWIDANTTHVTIGIGGNDARFAAVIKGCIMTLDPCMDPNYHLTTDSGVDPQPLTTYEPQVIDGIGPKLQNVYNQVHALAPNAQIIFLGYPHVVATQVRRSAPGCDQLDQQTIDWFAQMADRLDGVISGIASSNGATYVSPVQIFDGPPQHEACTADTSIEWINAVVAHSSSGSGSNTPGSGSFHPDATGHQADEAVIRLALH